SHRRRYGGSASKVQATTRRDRGPAYGWGERGRRLIRLRQDVSTTGREECTGDEESCRLSDAIHGSREICWRETAGTHRNGDGERRCARHRQKHRRSSAAM